MLQMQLLEVDTCYLAQRGTLEVGDLPVLKVCTFQAARSW